MSGGAGLVEYTGHLLRCLFSVELCSSLCVCMYVCVYERVCVYRPDCVLSPLLQLSAWKEGTHTHIHTSFPFPFYPSLGGKTKNHAFSDKPFLTVIKETEPLWYQNINPYSNILLHHAASLSRAARSSGSKQLKNHSLR